MKSTFDHSADRLADSEDFRARTTGFGTTRQGQAVAKRYRLQLATRIAEDRATGRNKAVWRALKGTGVDDLTMRLLVAGISVCASNTLGANDDGEATFRDTALWIGRNLCSRQGRETCFRVGAWGTNLLASLPAFDLASDHVLILTEPVHDLMDAVIERAVRTNPYLSPLTEPPPPWTQIYRGGLPADHWARVPLIRERHRTIEAAVRNAIGRRRMDQVLDAVNYLQSIPFVINKPVLDFMGGDAPIVDQRELPRWTKAAQKQREGLATLVVQELDRSIATALTRGRFWVPLTLDFRGRLYGVSHFAFSREDRIRGLFLFADGAPIGIEGTRWLKAHVAARADGNDWSHVKKPSNLDLAGRASWTDANLDLLLKIGDAVLQGADAKSLDWALRSISDKYQFVAACAELVKALNQGPEFISQLPLTFDATCSVLQHLCGMTRALEGCYVNLTPSDEGDDFYRRVAYRVFMLEDYVIDESAASLMKGPFDREIVKQPAMSYFYGARAGGWAKDKRGNWHPFGMTKQIVAVLKDRGQSPKGAQMLAQAMYDVIEGMVPKATAVRDFLETLAKLAAEQDKPLRWTTALGLPVINCYHRAEIKRISVPIGSHRKKTKLVIGDKRDVDDLRAVNAVTANFTHSADATHLQMVALAAAAENIPVVSVHDCYGTLAPHAARLNEIIREQFVRLHKGYNLLNEVRQSAKRDLHIEPPPLPEIGDAKIEDVLQSSHAFK